MDLFGECPKDALSDVLTLFKAHQRLCGERFGPSCRPNPSRLYYSNLYASGTNNHSVLTLEEQQVLHRCVDTLLQFVYGESSSPQSTSTRTSSSPASTCGEADVDPLLSEHIQDAGNPQRLVLTVGFLTAPPQNGTQRWHTDYEYPSDNIFVPLCPLTAKNGTEYLALPSQEAHRLSYPALRSYFWDEYMQDHPLSQRRLKQYRESISETDKKFQCEDLPPPFAPGQPVPPGGSNYNKGAIETDDVDTFWRDVGSTFEGAEVKRLMAPAHAVVRMPYYTSHHGICNEEDYDRSMFFICTKPATSELVLWSQHRRALVITPDDD